MEKTARILVVDDTPSSLKLLANVLRDDYELYVATNGADAIELARSEQPDLILLDVIMPGMDGYAVCAQLKATEATAGIPVIFITALSDTRDETKGFALGAVDYVIKPISVPILRARVRLHITLQQAQNELARAYRKLAEELDLLADLQARLLPSEVLDIPGLALTTLYNPSGKASGDYFDYFQLNENVLRLLVADVSGHGSRAAFVMAIVHSLIRKTRADYHTLSETMVQINEHLIEIIGEESDFVTMIAVDFNKATGEIEYVNAGHCPGALRLGNGKVESLPATATVLGFFKGAYPSRTIRAGNSFELLLYTDGLYEWRIEKGEIYSHERFRALIEQLMAEGRLSLSKLEQELRAQAAGTIDFDDDLTALHISWAAPSSESTPFRPA